MPAVNAATSASPSSTTSFGAEADALVSAASRQTGTLDPHLLAHEVAGLTPSQQRGVTSALTTRLSPMQQGQFQHETAKIAQAKADADLPKEYVRDASGKLQLSPDYAKQACANYNKIMTSNSKVADVVTFGGGGLTVSSLGARSIDAALGSAAGKTFGWLTAVAGGTTAALAHAPPPPGCEKK